MKSKQAHSGKWGSYCLQTDSVSRMYFCSIFTLLLFTNVNPYSVFFFPLCPIKELPFDQKINKELDAYTYTLSLFKMDRIQEFADYVIYVIIVIEETILLSLQQAVSSRQRGLENRYLSL